MEVVVSAITGDLVNRAMSFLIKRMINHPEEEEEEEKKMVERLQRLLARVHMVVEEAEGRYITNSRMLLELKSLMDGMYQGYHVLSTFRSNRSSSATVQDHDEAVAVSSSSRSSNTAMSSSLTRSSCINCFRTLATKSSTTRRSAICGGDQLELESVVDSLETMVSNMTEFVLLLGGCERMLRRPYDAYLYMDNFMFGRQVEKQQIINILLQDNDLPPDFAPTVLPIVGTSRVGKNTLVTHVCDNERVRSHFPSILRLTISSLESLSSSPSSSRKAHHNQEGGKRTLFVVQFSSDNDDVVDDESWQKFYRSATRIGGRGSKIIVITRSEKLSTRLGTVRPVRLNGLSLQEYSYLFKVLAFGSTNPEEHPRLASVADELAVLMGGSLVTANVCADVFRNNQSIHLWLHVLNKYRNVVANNLSTFSEHPKLLMDRNHRTDITKLVSGSASAAPARALLLMPPHSEEDESTRCLQKVKFVDLIAGSAVLPKDQEFELVAWESRIAPYKKFVNIATFSDEVDNVSESEPHRSPPSPGKKRRRNHP